MAKIKKIDLRKIINPPAIEVVLDIRLAEEEGLSPENFTILDKAFNRRFSKKDPLAFFEGTLDHGKGEIISSKHGTYGFVYKNENGNELTQFRLNGFSYHSLKYYPLWPEFLKNAFYVWKKYKACRKNHEFVRLGLRYINLIKIPKSTKKLSEYFDVNINFPSDNSKIGNVKQFQYRYFSDFSDTNCSSIVNFVQQPVSTTDEYKNFILDIDIIMKELPNKINDDILKGLFEKMRKIKNEVFKAHLTNKTLEMFK